MPKYEIFIDGSCQVCNREARWIRKNDKQNLFKLINIAEPLDEAPGRPPLSQLNLKLHLREISTDSWLTGIDAMIIIWTETTKQRWLEKFLKLPLIYSLAKFGYFCFARLRIYLPKRKDCRL